MVLRIRQQGCQTSQENKDDRRLKQIQAPGKVPFHHCKFIPPDGLCLSFPICKSNTFQ